MTRLVPEWYQVYLLVSIFWCVIRTRWYVGKFYKCMSSSVAQDWIWKRGCRLHGAAAPGQIPLRSRLSQFAVTANQPPLPSYNRPLLLLLDAAIAVPRLPLRNIQYDPLVPLSISLSFETKFFSRQRIKLYRFLICIFCSL